MASCLDSDVPYMFVSVTVLRMSDCGELNLSLRVFFWEGIYTSSANALTGKGLIRMPIFHRQLLTIAPLCEFYTSARHSIKREMHWGD